MDNNISKKMSLVEKIRLEYGSTGLWKMSLLEKIDYGCGNMGLCLITSLVTTYMMYFYSDIVKISLVQISTIMMLGGVADAISDPLMGIIIDKTNTKWGKCRPYLLFCTIPLGLVVSFMFRIPDASSSIKYIYCLVMYILYTIAYTAICIPQTVMLASVTDDEQDRLETNMFGTLGTNIGQLLVGALTITLVSFLGAGSEYKGYQRTIIIFATVGVLLLLTCFKNSRERITQAHGEKITAKDLLQSFKNLPWFICTLTILLNIAAIVVRATQTIYYAQYVVGNVAIGSILLTIANLMGIPIAMLVPVLAPKLGKRNMVIMGSIMAIAGCIGVYFSTSSTVLILFFTVIASIGMSIPNSVVNVMSAESVDYGEWKNGKRVQGSLLAFIGFGVKIANSIATMVASAILASNGYIGGEAVQTEAAVKAIQFNYLVIPMIMFGIIIVANLFYKLDKQYPQIKAELDARRRAAVAQ